MNHTTAALEIVAAARRLGEAGLIAATEGNLSVRLDDGYLLATPSGRRKAELEPGHLVPVDLETGAPLDSSGPRPTSDLAIHLAILRSRADVRAIAHAHLPASMALTLAGETPDPAALPETEHFLGRLPLVPLGAMGSEDLANRVAATFAEPPAPLRSRSCSSGTARTPLARALTKPSRGWSSSRCSAARGATPCSFEPPAPP